MVRLLAISFLVLALVPLPASAARSSALDEPLAAEPKTVNGHWECQCRCGFEDGTSVAANLPGKCDGSEEGSSCQAGDEYGTLSGCNSIFVIDE